MKNNDRLTDIIAESLNAMKRDSHLTQKEIADRIGVERSTVCYYLKGQRKIYIDTFMKFCKACGKDPYKELDKIMEKYNK